MQQSHIGNRKTVSRNREKKLQDGHHNESIVSRKSQQFGITACSRTYSGGFPALWDLELISEPLSLKPKTLVKKGYFSKKGICLHARLLIVLGRLSKRCQKAFQPEFGAYRGLARVLRSPLNSQNCGQKAEHPGKGHFYFLRQTLVCTKPWVKRDLKMVLVKRLATRREIVCFNGQEFLNHF